MGYNRKICIPSWMRNESFRSPISLKRNRQWPGVEWNFTVPFHLCVRCTYRMSKIYPRALAIQRATLVILLQLYSGDEVWEGIWNQIHLVVLNYCLERLYHFIMSHDKARSNRWCQWPELLRTCRTVNFCNWDNAV